MLYKVGLLPSHNRQQIPFAYKMYKRHDAQGYLESSQFKKTFCRAVSVHFLGVWLADVSRSPSRQSLTPIA